MGLLDRVKDRAKVTARKIADKGLEQINNRLGLPTTRQEDPGRSNDGPVFGEAGDKGLEGWSNARPLLQELGGASHGLFQARLVESELALREALDQLEASVRSSGGDPVVWRQATERIASAWQDQNARILEAWRQGFERLDLAWDAAGSQVRSTAWRRAWSEAAAKFDSAWLSEWETLQGVLEDMCGELRKLFLEVGATPGFNPEVGVGTWQKAISSVDGGLRRANGDLWGVWGTAAALIRKCSRQVIEGEGTAHDIYPPAFARMGEDFEKAIRANAADLRDSWLAAVRMLRQGVEGGP